MGQAHGWRTVHRFCALRGSDDADAETHGRMFAWRFAGGADAGLPSFAPSLEAVKAGRLDRWLTTPPGRLSLIVVLDQFPRGPLPGTPETYAGDSEALWSAEEGLRAL